MNPTRTLLIHRLALFLLIAAHGSFALAQAQVTTPETPPLQGVLLRAEACKDRKDQDVARLRSTVLVFRSDEQVYAIAPESRTYPAGGPGGFCHRLEFPDGTRADAEIVVADWGSALTLLKVSLSREEALKIGPLPTPMSPQDAKPPLQFAGSQDGVILSGESDRHVVPDLERRRLGAIEIIRTPLTAPKVGAPILDSTGTWIGLATQNTLELRKEAPTFIGAIASGDDRAAHRHWIALPARFVSQWIKRTLNENEPTRLMFDSEERAKGKFAVTTGKLRVQLDCPSGPNDAGPGYSAAYPIGGGDGSGIGGSYTTGSACKARVTLAPVPTPRENELEWSPHYRKIVRLLEAEPTASVEVWYLSERDPAQRSVPWAFGSLDELFKDSGLPGPFLSSRILMPGETVAGDDPTIRAFREQAGFLAQTAIDGLNSKRVLGIKDSKNFLRQVHYLGKVIESESLWGVRSRDLKELLPDSVLFGQAWKILKADPDVAQRLETHLRALLQLYQKMGL